MDYLHKIEAEMFIEQAKKLHDGVSHFIGLIKECSRDASHPAYIPESEKELVNSLYGSLDGINRYLEIVEGNLNKK